MPNRPFFHYIVSIVAARLIFVLLLLLPARPQAGEVVWVFFVDKGVGGERIREVLHARMQELSPRTLERRLRVRSDAGVDVRDLQVHADYVDAVLSTGAVLRTTSRWLNAASIEASIEEIEVISG